jgi:hypothetical protein
MISLWALLSEADVEGYAGTLLLPVYLAHLRLGPFRFRDQVSSSDGQEPLKLTYCGEGRLEEYWLRPEGHVLGMIRFVSPRIHATKIRLPQDDARWHWTTSADPPDPMRIYFEPGTRTLYGRAASTPSPEAYVSVSRRHVFIGRPVVESYLRAWLESLGIDHEAAQFEFDTPSGGVDFTAGAVGGQMFLSDNVIAEDLIRFAGLRWPLAQVGEWVELDRDGALRDGCGIRQDGAYIGLAVR